MDDEGTCSCGWDLITDDALVDILLDVPPSSRGRGSASSADTGAISSTRTQR